MPAVPPSSLGLQRVKLLEGLSSARIEALAAQCSWRRFDAGQPIFARHGRDRDVLFIVSGRVRVTMFSAGGRQVTFRDQDPGEMFGDLAAIDGLPRSADVVALDEVLVAALTPGAFRELIATESQVQERVLRRLAALVRSLSERVIDLSTLGVQNRIHAELLRLGRAAAAGANQARLDPAPKHADIASQVSTYREQVTREISALVKQGLVAKAGQALLLNDLARLEKMVEEVRSEG